MLTLSQNDRITGPLVATAGDTIFSSDFPAYAQEDIDVIRERGGVYAVLANPADYTVSNLAVQNGVTATLGAGAEEGDRYWIVGAVNPLPKVSFSLKQPFSSEETNREFDRLWMVINEIRRRDADPLSAIRGTLALPPGQADLELPPLQDGRIIGWSATGLRNWTPGEILEALGATEGAGTVSHLALLIAADDIEITNSGGAGVTLPLATNTNAGLQSPAHRAFVQALIDNPAGGDNGILVEADVLTSGADGGAHTPIASWSSAAAKQYQGGQYKIDVSDGLQDLNTFIDVHQGQLLIAASAAPDTIQITAIAFTLIAGNDYSCTVTVAAALPAHVVVDYAVGIQNAKGDGGAHAVNGAHVVKAIAGDRLSFTFDLQVYGIAPTNPTALDNTLTLGMAANQLIIPKACLKLNSTAWDAVSRLAAFAVNDGAGLVLDGIGLTYAGADDAHCIVDLEGGNLKLTNCVIAGAGDTLILSGNGGQMRAEQCQFGGGLTADAIWAGDGNSGLSLLRCCLGSVGVTLISSEGPSSSFVNECVLAGGVNGVATKRPAASVSLAGGCRVMHCTEALRVEKGSVAVTAQEEIRNNTDPIKIHGAGYVYGDPLISNNANATIAANEFISGGGWFKADAPLTSSGGGGGWSVFEWPFVTGGSGSAAHLLGGEPDEFQLHLVCTSAEAGYSVNDAVFIGSNTGFANGMMAGGANPTDVYWSNYNAPHMTLKGGGSYAVLTPSKWKIRIRVR